MHAKTATRHACIVNEHDKKAPATTLMAGAFFSVMHLSQRFVDFGSESAHDALPLLTVYQYYTNARLARQAFNLLKLLYK
jgi:hypothetical protein